eukprot:jgi/Botrbrau1/15077/Bobra.0286s0006.2
MAFLAGDYAMPVGVGASNFSYCEQHPSSYTNRTLDPDHFNWCVVPDSGYDGILFGCTAVLAAILATGKFSALFMLLAGGVSGALSIAFNLGHFSNGIAIWLGIQPADLFLYIFLPPLLLDSAVRIDAYIFKKVRMMVMAFAVQLVLASTLAMIPIMLYGLNLRAQNWQWQHAALFSAMIASTDAVAVSAILKKGGGPESWVVLMEGESLFNDATSIVLFEIFFELVKKLGHGGKDTTPFLKELPTLTFNIITLGGGGALIGYISGWIEKTSIKLLRYRGDTPAEELALSVLSAYLIFFFANTIVGVSGVIAVVVFGLYGGATAKWAMSPPVVEKGIFYHFWDTISFIMNGMVFFFAGASSVNFFYRSTTEIIADDGALSAVIGTFWRLPLIFVAMMLLRFIGISFLRPVFRFLDTKPVMTTGSALFATFGGLRGALSLVMAQMVVASQQDLSKKDRAVTAQIALWTAGVVLCTLLINAPLLPKLLKWTGLLAPAGTQQVVRGKLVRALLRHTKAVISDLQTDDDEFLSGADWEAVREFTDVEHDLAPFAGMPLDLAGHTRLNRPSYGRHFSFKAMYGAQPEKFTFDRAQSELDVPILSARSGTDLKLRASTSDAEPVLHSGQAEGSSASEAVGASRSVPPPLSLVPGPLAANGQAKVLTLDSVAAESADVPLLLADEPSLEDPAVVVSSTKGPILLGSKTRRRGSTLGEWTHSLTSPFAAAAARSVAVTDADVEAGKSSSSASVAGGQGAGRVRQTRLPSVIVRNLSTLVGSRVPVSYSSEVSVISGEEEACRTEEEMRERLVLGLKRFFHHRRMEGLLTSAGLGILDDVCHDALFHPDQPLRMYHLLKLELISVWSKRASAALFHLKRASVRAEVFSSRAPFLLRLFLRAFTIPLSAISGWLGYYLGRTMLMSIEVVMAYQLALASSATAQLVAATRARKLERLRHELQREMEKAQKFIIDREIEAPARFQAIQSFRAAMAVLHRQEKFIHQLYEGGFVDENEAEALKEPVDKRIRTLFYKGPDWTSLKYTDVLRGLPLLRVLSENGFKEVLEVGHLLTFPPETQIWPVPGSQEQEGGAGFFVIVSGLVRLHSADDTIKYLGQGGFLGVVAAATQQQEEAHGTLAWGVGNALGHGPVLFWFPPQLLSRLARLDLPPRDLSALELQLFRVAGVAIVEDSRDSIVQKVVDAYEESSQTPRPFLRSATQKTLVPEDGADLPEHHNLEGIFDEGHNLPVRMSSELVEDQALDSTSCPCQTSARGHQAGSEGRNSPELGIVGGARTKVTPGLASGQSICQHRGADCCTSCPCRIALASTSVCFQEGGVRDGNHSYRHRKPPCHFVGLPRLKPDT